MKQLSKGLRLPLGELHEGRRHDVAVAVALRTPLGTRGREESLGSDAMGNVVEIRPALKGRVVACSLCANASGTLQRFGDTYAHPACHRRKARP